MIPSLLMLMHIQQRTSQRLAS